MIQVQQQSGVEATLTGGIQQGMPVYDVNDVMLGVVGHMHPGRESGAIEPAVIEYFDRIPDMPVSLKTYLWHEGFLEVDTGVLFSNYLVLPHQIADVTYEGVYLLCHRDELLMA